MNDVEAASVVDIRWSEQGSYYRIRNQSAIDEIVQNVRNGHYCTVLGPPFCQKSALLEDVKEQLQAKGEMVCLLLNLKEIDFVSDDEFLPMLAASIKAGLEAEIGVVGDRIAIEVTDGRGFQYFLQSKVDSLDCDLVLLLDQLEHIREGPLKLLLKVLRAIYNERNPNARNRLVVVIATALSIAALSLGPESPFNIARLTQIRDLSPEESARLIDFAAQHKDLTLDVDVHRRCFEATCGDRYLIGRLCEHSGRTAERRKAKHITGQDLEKAVEHLAAVEDESASRPLKEARRALESSPVALLDVIDILEQGPLPPHKLRLDLAADVDELQLSGAVRVYSSDEQRRYAIRNPIYKRYLERHFDPNRVAHVLTMSGQWRDAIEYLMRLVTKDKKYRAVLLNTVTDAIYSSQNEQEAYSYLGEPLICAFGIPRASLYRVKPDRTCLERVAEIGEGGETTAIIPLSDRGRPEIRAFFEQDYHVGNSDTREHVLCAPLKRDNNSVIGVAVVHGFGADPAQDEFQDLQAFLRQVGRAIGSVVEREQKLRQLRVLHETGRKITSLDLDQVLKAVVEGAIEAVPAAQKGSLFLWDAEKRKLIIREHLGFDKDVVDMMQLAPGEGYAGWVYEQRKPLLLPDLFADPRTKWVDHPDVKAEMCAMCVPLEAWGRVMGVLCLDNAAAYDVFQQQDLALLSTFGAQAALALQNASVYTELYNLGMQINQGNLTPDGIFQQTVRSITLVSGAEGANMLLLRDSDTPALSVAQKPLLSKSDGLGDDYDDKVHPRSDGLTYQVLTTRQPAAVGNPEEPPGINPLAFERGTRAYLCLPMMIQDKIIGVLFVHQNEEHQFSESETQMLSLFANQAALAIQNSRQQEDLEITEKVAWAGITFSTLAHRITQRSATIRNVVWGLRKQWGAEPTATERLDRIDDNAKQLNALAREVVGEAFDEQPESISLNQLIKLNIRQWYDEGDHVTFELDPKEPAVYGDPVRLAFVIEILTTNAVRAMRRTPERALTVRSEVKEQRVEVTMTNTGAIPERIQDSLFKEPIVTEEGMGIGLLIVRYILRRYQGDIEFVTPSLDENTTRFVFRLPLYHASAAPKNAQKRG